MGGNEHVLVVHVGNEPGLVHEAVPDVAEAGFLFGRGVRVAQDEGALAGRLVVGLGGGVLEGDAAEAASTRVAQPESGCYAGLVVLVIVGWRGDIGGSSVEAVRGRLDSGVVVDALAVGLALLASAEANDGLGGRRRLHQVRGGGYFVFNSLCGGCHGEGLGSG